MSITRILAPRDNGIVDVADPRDPTMVIRSDLSRDRVRSNCLSLTGDILAVTAWLRAAANR